MGILNLLADWLGDHPRRSPVATVAWPEATAVLMAPTEPARSIEPFRLRRIEGRSSPDFPTFERFVLSASVDYRWQVQGRLPTLADVDTILSHLPPGARPDQKYLWGIWDGAEMVGCLEVVRAWPTPERLSIGLLLIDPKLQRSGLGHRALGLLAARTKAWAKLRCWRILVVQNQHGALRFWRRQGFQAAGEVRDPKFLAPLVIMERRLHG